MQIANSFYHLFEQPLRPQILHQEHQILLLQVQDSIKFSNYVTKSPICHTNSRTTLFYFIFLLLLVSGPLDKSPFFLLFCVLSAGSGSKTVPSTDNGTSDANSTKLTMSRLFFLLFITSYASTLVTI